MRMSRKIKLLKFLNRYKVQTKRLIIANAFIFLSLLSNAFIYFNINHILISLSMYFSQTSSSPRLITSEKVIKPSFFHRNLPRNLCKHQLGIAGELCLIDTDLIVSQINIKICCIQNILNAERSPRSDIQSEMYSGWQKQKNARY